MWSKEIMDCGWQYGMVAYQRSLQQIGPSLPLNNMEHQQRLMVLVETTIFLLLVTAHKIPDAR